MKEHEMNGDAIQESIAPYGFRDNDDDTWHYACFQYYRSLGGLAALQNLLVNELTLIAVDKSKAVSSQSHTLLVCAVDAEIKRLGKQAHHVTDFEHVYYWFFRDLVEIGCDLIRQGVKIEKMAGLLGMTRVFHEGEIRRFLERIRSTPWMSDLMKKHIKKFSPDRYYQKKKRVKTLMQFVEGIRSQSDLTEAIMGTVEPKLGTLGSIIALCDILGEDALNTQLKELKVDQALNKKVEIDLLRVKVVDLLLEYKIRGVYQTGARLINGLLSYPEYKVQRDPITYRSKGEESLRSQYRTYMREKGIRNRQK